ncbi:MAG: CocE/NonD family hydrolase [Solirubrobacterales bacterium]
MSRRPGSVWAATAFALALFCLPAPAGAATPSLQPLGHECTPLDAVWFCPNPGRATRTPSFDGVPLDVDVTLPSRGKPPYPTIVMLHGYGGTKASFETSSPEGPGPWEAHTATLYRYNNLFFARRGYAVVNYTARGFGESCGGGASGDHEGACAKGYIRLADSRYEARDTQHLLGLLADQGVTDPKRIGVTGISYGGGQTYELAFLRNKIRRPTGKLAPWRSPNGKPMRIAAAYPRWGWSDLVAALIPNGRSLDSKVAPKGQSTEPFGTPIASFLNGLYLTGAINGYYCGGAPASTPCADRQADITQDFAWIQAGQPLPKPALGALASIYRNSSGYPLRFLEGAPRPAPLLLQSGWTDELFPPQHSLRVYRYLRSRYGGKAAVSIQLGDLGHSRGTDKPKPNHYFNNQAARFFAHYVLGGKQGRPRPGGVFAFPQTCPLAAPDGEVRKAKSWGASHPGSFTVGGGAGQSFTSSGGDPAVARAFDPVFGTTDACKTIPVTAEPNVATYSRRVGKGFMLMGLPTVRATIASSGRYGQIAARLWDVSPDGTQLLVSRGVYALTSGQRGEIVFQLHGNGYRFAPGHTVRLQLLGRDAPYYQPSSAPFTVRVKQLQLRLPTVQRRPR